MTTAIMRILTWRNLKDQKNKSNKKGGLKTPSICLVTTYRFVSLALFLSIAFCSGVISRQASLA
jgi:hypothetical protein